MGDLDGKVAAITGGTRGIGFGIARAFLDNGAAGVVINGRSPDKGKAAVEELDAPGRTLFVEGDVKTKEGCESVIDRTVAEFGRIDILVNNAGGATTHPLIVDMTDQQWHDVINWNLNATFYATRRALPHMIEKGWGRIVNISSLHGKMNSPTISHYASAKHGIHGFTKSCAQEVGRYGITVNVICPGLVPTDIIDETFEDVAKALGLPSAEAMTEIYLQTSATKQMCTVEECANAAMMFVRPDSAGITGTILSVDGGIAPY